MSNVKSYGLPEPARTAFIKWWKAISPDAARGQFRSDRAVLRRAGSLTAVACTPAYQRVFASMSAAMKSVDESAAWRPYQLERLAALVALAAHVKTDNALSLPKAMSQQTEGSDRNAVSELRFSRLLDAPDIESLFNGLRRSLPLIDHAVSPTKLADDVFSWNDTTKKSWAYDYAWPTTSAA